MGVGGKGSVANPNSQLSTGNIGIDNWQHSHNGNIQQENSTLQLELKTTTITSSLLQPPTLSDEDIARGYWLESAITSKAGAA